MTNDTYNGKNSELDLNLLILLNAVIETGSATLAAERLKLSSSSISYALNKLREHFSDPIVIRTASGVKPTLLAINLYNNTRPLLDELNATLKKFDFAGSTELSSHSRTIRIRCNSIIDFWLSHQLIADKKYQQGYVFEFTSYPHDREQCLELLRNKQIDIDIGFHLGNYRAIVKKPFPNVKLVVLFRSDHPRISDRIDKKQLAQEVKFGWINRHGMNSPENPLLSWFTEKNIHRTYLSDSMINCILHIVNSDAITIVPEFIAPLLCELFSLRYLYCNFFDDEKYVLFCHTHKSNSDDPVLNDIINIMMGEERRGL